MVAYRPKFLFHMHISGLFIEVCQWRLAIKLYFLSPERLPIFHDFFIVLLPGGQLLVFKHVGKLGSLCIAI